MTNQEKTKLRKALKVLIAWVHMEDWDIKVEFGVLVDLYAQADINSAYKQATITMNTKEALIKYKNITDIKTLCHEFAHIWLWDVHHPELYTENTFYRRLVEGTVDSVGMLLYEKVLEPKGF